MATTPLRCLDENIRPSTVEGLAKGSTQVQGDQNDHQTLACDGLFQKPQAPHGAARLQNLNHTPKEPPPDSGTDQQCKLPLIFAEQNLKILTLGLVSAFDMAREAATFLEVDPIDPDAQKMYDYLFIPEAKTRVLSVLQNVGKFFDPNTDKTNAADVVIYCDLGRYQKREDGLLYDPDINQAEAKPGITDGCRLLDTTLAYTVTQKNPNKVQQIQICPWYLNMVATQEYQFASTADFTTRLKGWIAKAFNKIQTWRGSLTTMDALALFDHTLLHELTHTRGAGATTDVSGGSNSYDSMAFFALAIKIMARGNLPQLDGTVSMVGGNTNKKRSDSSWKFWRA
ncbi:MAG: hypothetical protein Q9218_003625 [Villophora microphyllina]